MPPSTAAGVMVDTLRLRLRELCDSDAPFILELLTDRDFLANVGDRGVHDLDGAHRYIREGPGASYRLNGFGLYLVERRADAAPLGICGLLHRDSHPDVEIGFALVPRARGAGYALEAAQATMALATGRFGLKKVVAITAPDNHASIRILERLGLHDQGLLAWSGDERGARLFVYGAIPL